MGRRIWIGLAAAVVVAAGVWITISWTRSSRQPPRPTVGQNFGMTVTGGEGSPYANSPAPQWATTRPASDAVLSGRITDSDGKPIVGAAVKLEGPSYLTAKTDAQGIFQFPKIKSAGQYRVGVTAGGFLPIEPYVGGTPPIELSPASHAVRDIILQRGATILAIVTDSNGQPIVGANVDADPITDNRWGGVQTIREPSDASGQAKLMVPASGKSYLIAASRAGFAPSHAIVKPDVAKAQHVVLQMLPGIQITGVAICSDGKPATGWEIQARPDWSKSNYWPNGAPIDAKGNFTLKDVGPGKWNLSLYLKTSTGRGSSFVVATMDFPPSRQPIHLSIPHASPRKLMSISGQIHFVGHGDWPYRVSLEVYGDGSEIMNPFGQVTLARRGPPVVIPTPAGPIPPIPPDGTFVVKDMPPGAYRLMFSAPSIETVTLEHVQVPGKALPTVDLKLIPPPRIAGQVTDAASGSPIGQFAVRIRKLQTLGGPGYDQDANWIQVSRPDGKYGVDLVGPGIYQAQASANGYAWLWSKELRIEKGAVTADFALTTGGSLEGTVVDSSGKPVEGAKIIPLSIAKSLAYDGRGKERFDGDAGAVVTNAQGKFTLAHLAPGQETLKIVSSDFAPTIAPKLQVIDGKTSDAGVIHLAAGGSAEGVVYDEHGKPSPGVTLQFQDENAYSGGGDERAGRLAPATTDSAGHYRVEHLAEQVIYVRPSDPWQRLGVVARVFRATNGTTAHLDFGGTTPIKGRLLDGAKPVANTRIELAEQSPYFSPVMVSAMTGDDGRFTFFGPPVGHYTLYRQTPGQRGDWVRMKSVDVSDQPLALGDVGSDVADVPITIKADDPAMLKTIRYVYVGDGRPGTLWSAPISTASPIDAGAGKWLARNIPSGRFRASAYVEAAGDRPTLQLFAPFERQPGSHPGPVELHVPRASATAAITFTHVPTDPHASKSVTLRNADSSIQTYAGAGDSDHKTIHLPPGTYRILENGTQQPRTDLDPIVLKDGQTTSVTIDLSPPPVDSAATFAVELPVWASDGVLDKAATMQLRGSDGKTFDPIQDGSLGRLYLLPRGIYRVVIKPAGTGEQQTRQIAIPEDGKTKGRSRWMTIDLFLK